MALGCREAVGGFYHRGPGTVTCKNPERTETLDEASYRSLKVKEGLGAAGFALVLLIVATNAYRNQPVGT